MATKPSNLAEWATSGGASITEPLLAEKQAGWPVAFKPPAQWFNWWQKLVHQWIVWLDAFEGEAHTWTALQTFNAGVLAAAFGSTAGIRGTTAISGVPGVRGSSTTSAPAVFGTSSHADGQGGYFTNTAGSGIGAAIYAEGRIGISAAGSFSSAIEGILQATGDTTFGAGIKGISAVLGRPGIRGEGDESFGAMGGEFLGSPSGESSVAGGLGLRVRGGASSLTDFATHAGDGIDVTAGAGLGEGNLGQANNAGTNWIRGGSVDGTVNDEGEPGVGLWLYGGDVTDDGNSRIGATALKLFAGQGGAGPGKALEAVGDVEIDGVVQLVDGPLASSTPQPSSQLTRGLIVRAWARVRWTGGAISILGGQNVAAVGFQAASSGRFYLDLATPYDKDTRAVIASGDSAPGTNGGRIVSPLDSPGGVTYGRSDDRIVFEVTDAATPSTVNLSTGTGFAYVVVFGV